jgi:hypothetical protein
VADKDVALKSRQAVFLHEYWVSPSIPMKQG